MMSINKSAASPFSRTSLLAFARSSGLFHAKKSASSPRRNESGRSAETAEGAASPNIGARGRRKGDGGEECVLRLAVLPLERGEGEAAEVEESDKGGVLSWEAMCCGL